jgi:hypothetical protein
MNAEILKNKKITLTTLKSFIKKSDKLFVETISSFSGMSDMVEMNEDRQLIEVSKEKAIGHEGVWIVGNSRDYFKFMETETHYGIKVYNACGSEILWTNK